MKDALHTAVADSPWIGVGALSLWGVSLEAWVVILAALYGLARLGLLALEAYWKIKDRRDARLNRKPE